ncbi:MAG TPA: thioesterase family protein [Anaeromyxobacter sp.]
MDRYAKTFTVRWADCDANGHMRNTAYSEYAIDVRIAFLSEHGFAFDQFLASGIGPVLLREEIDYLRELKLGESVEVDFRQLGHTADGSRFRLQHDFTKSNGKQAARLVLELAWMDLSTRRLAPPPEPLGRAMALVPRGEGWAELAPRERK